MHRKVFLSKLGTMGAMIALPIQTLIPKESSRIYQNKKLNHKLVRSNEGKELTIFGNKQLHKLRGRETNQEFFEWTDYLSPGAGIPPHIHTKEDEVFRVNKGKISFTIDGKTSVLTPGDIAFAPKGIPHSWQVVGDEEAQLNVSVFPAGMEFMFDELNQLPPGKPDVERIKEISAAYGINFI